MKQIIETKRLNIREFSYSDAVFIVKLFNSPAYKKYIGNNNVNNFLDGENYLFKGPIKSYEVNKFGLWMVELKNNKTPIGLCGFDLSDNIKHPYLNCAYLPQFYRNGFAFEAATAILNYANEILKINSVFANTVKENIPAIKLIEKLGFEFKKNIKMPLGQEDLMLYSN